MQYRVRDRGDSGVRAARDLHTLSQAEAPKPPRYALYGTVRPQSVRNTPRTANDTSDVASSGLRPLIPKCTQRGTKQPSMGAALHAPRSVTWGRNAEPSVSSGPVTPLCCKLHASARHSNILGCGRYVWGLSRAGPGARDRCTPCASSRCRSRPRTPPRYRLGRPSSLSPP